MVRLQTNLFTIPSPYSFGRDAGAGGFAFYPGVCGEHHLRRAAPRVRPGAFKSSQSVNAFLTLTAVTKW